MIYTKLNELFCFGVTLTTLVEATVQQVRCMARSSTNHIVKFAGDADGVPSCGLQCPQPAASAFPLAAVEWLYWSGHNCLPGWSIEDVCKNTPQLLCTALPLPCHRQRGSLSHVKWLFNLWVYSLFASLIPRGRFFLARLYAVASPDLNAVFWALSRERASPVSHGLWLARLLMVFTTVTSSMHLLMWSMTVALYSWRSVT